LDLPPPKQAAIIDIHQNMGRYIGTLRTGKVNYEADEKVWTPELIPLKAQAVKKDVKKFIDPDVLGLRHPLWNKSVHAENTSATNPQSLGNILRQVRMGLMDQPTFAQRVVCLPLGTDSRNSGDGWNISVQADPPRPKALEKMY
jgi:hypothetical protein